MPPETVSGESSANVSAFETRNQLTGCCWLPMRSSAEVTWPTSWQPTEPIGGSIGVFVISPR